MPSRRDTQSASCSARILGLLLPTDSSPTVRQLEKCWRTGLAEGTPGVMTGDSRDRFMHKPRPPEGLAPVSPIKLLLELRKKTAATSHGRVRAAARSMPCLCLARACMFLGTAHLAVPMALTQMRLTCVSCTRDRPLVAAQLPPHNTAVRNVTSNTCRRTDGSRTPRTTCTFQRTYRAVRPLLAQTLR